MNKLRTNDINDIITDHCFCTEVVPMGTRFKVMRNSSAYTLTFFDGGCAYRSDSVGATEAENFFKRKRFFFSKLEAAIADVKQQNTGKAVRYLLQLPALLDYCKTDRYFACFQFAPRYKEVFSYGAGGLTEAGSKASSDTINSIFSNLLLALSALHKRGIAYGCVNADGVYIYSKGNVCLLNYAYSRQTAANGKPCAEPLPQPLPEGGYATCEGDMYMFGAFILAVCLGVSVNCLPSEEEIFRADDSRLTALLKSVARWCLEENPLRRPTAEELIFLFSDGNLLKIPQRYRVSPSQSCWSADEELQNVPAGVSFSRGAVKGEYELCLRVTATRGQLPLIKEQFLPMLDNIKIVDRPAPNNAARLDTARKAFEKLSPKAKGERDFYVGRLHLYAKLSDIIAALNADANRSFCAHNGDFRYIVRIAETVMPTVNDFDALRLENSQRVFIGYTDYRNDMLTLAPPKSVAPVAAGELKLRGIPVIFYAEVNVDGKVPKDFPKETLVLDLARSLASFHAKGLVIGCFGGDCYSFVSDGTRLVASFNFGEAVSKEGFFPTNELCLCALTQRRNYGIAPEIANFDPEYDGLDFYRRGVYSKESDVFAFGVFISKLLGGSLPTINGEKGIPADIAAKYINHEWTLGSFGIPDRAVSDRISNMLQWALAAKDNRATAARLVDVLEGRIERPRISGAANRRAEKATIKTDFVESSREDGKKVCKPWKGDKLEFCDVKGVEIYRTAKEGRYTLRTPRAFFASITGKALIERGFAVSTEAKRKSGALGEASATSCNKTEATDERVWSCDNITLIPREGVSVVKDSRKSYYYVTDSSKSSRAKSYSVYYLVKDGYAQFITEASDGEVCMDDILDDSHSPIAQSEEFTAQDVVAEDLDSCATSGVAAPVSVAVDTTDDLDELEPATVSDDLDEIEATATVESVREFTRNDTGSEPCTATVTETTEEKGIDNPKMVMPSVDDELWACDSDITLTLPAGVILKRASKQPIYVVEVGKMKKFLNKAQLLAQNLAIKK